MHPFSEFLARGPRSGVFVVALMWSFSAQGPSFFFNIKGFTDACDDVNHFHSLFFPGEYDGALGLSTLS
jgi:hypothetical protein